MGNPIRESDQSMTTTEKPSAFPGADDPVCGWLWAATEPGKNATTSRPFSIERDGQTWTFATNGYVMVGVPQSLGFPPLDAPESVRNLLATLPDGPAYAVLSDDLLAAIQQASPPPALLPPCDECQSTGRIDCAECDGVGEAECECFSCGHCHDVDCKKCDGEGWLPCACGREPARDEPPMIYRIADGYFNVLALRGIAGHLPTGPMEFRQSAPNRAATLAAPSFLLIWMPMNPNTIEPEHIHGAIPVQMPSGVEVSHG